MLIFYGQYASSPGHCPSLDISHHFGQQIIVLDLCWYFMYHGDTRNLTVADIVAEFVLSDHVLSLVIRFLISRDETVGWDPL